MVSSPSPDAKGDQVVTGRLGRQLDLLGPRRITLEELHHGQHAGIGRLLGATGDETPETLREIVPRSRIELGVAGRLAEHELRVVDQEIGWRGRAGARTGMGAP